MLVLSAAQKMKTVMTRLENGERARRIGSIFDMIMYTMMLLYAHWKEGGGG